MKGMKNSSVVIITICLLLGIFVAVSCKDVGIAFDEFMEGYFDYGQMSYEQAYENGKQKNQALSFSLTMSAKEMEIFLRDNEHTMKATGHVTIDKLTAQSNTTGTLTVFDHGTHEHQLFLKYFLPFQVNGKDYHLDGVKIIYGDDCLNIYTMATTLYVYIREGQEKESGNIVMTGIVTINASNILKLIFSFRAAQSGGTSLDFFWSVEEFSSFVLSNIKDDCLNTSSFRNDFWYIWVSDGSNGFLLDLIKRPTELELRLDLYSIQDKPKVIKQFLPLSAFKQENQVITMGPLTLSRDNCNGTVNATQVNVQFQLSSHSNNFIYDLVRKALPILPDVSSTYGTLTGASVAGFSYEKGLPLVYTTYAIPYFLSAWQWAMISAMKFKDTDLQIEMMALNLELWVSSAYVYYHGKEYHLNNPLLLESKMIDTGTIVDNKRVFSAQISSVLSQIDMSISCEAPVEQFALLEKEGDTEIHTTLLGTCKATDNKGGNTYYSTGVLLEIKVAVETP